MISGLFGDRHQFPLPLPAPLKENTTSTFSKEPRNRFFRLLCYPFLNSLFIQYLLITSFYILSSTHFSLVQSDFLILWWTSSTLYWPLILWPAIIKNARRTTDRPTDRRTDPLIEMRGRIYKVTKFGEKRSISSQNSLS